MAPDSGYRCESHGAGKSSLMYVDIDFVPGWLAKLAQELPAEASSVLNSGESR